MEGMAKSNPYPQSAKLVADWTTPFPVSSKPKMKSKAQEDSTYQGPGRPPFPLKDKTAFSSSSSAATVYSKDSDSQLQQQRHEAALVTSTWKPLMAASPTETTRMTFPPSSSYSSSSSSKAYMAPSHFIPLPPPPAAASESDQKVPQLHVHLGSSHHAYAVSMATPPHLSRVLTTAASSTASSTSTTTTTTTTSDRATASAIMLGRTLASSSHQQQQLPSPVYSLSASGKQQHELLSSPYTSSSSPRHSTPVLRSGTLAGGGGGGGGGGTSTWNSGSGGSAAAGTTASPLKPNCPTAKVAPLLGTPSRLDRKEGGSTLQLETQNEQLKAEYSDTLVAKNATIERLTKKLDATEVELHKVLSSLTESAESASRNQEALEQQLEDQAHSMAALRQRLSEADAVNTKLKQDLDKLSGYFGAMPTAEEHRALEEQVRVLTARCDALEKQAVSREHEMEGAMEELSTKSELAQRLEVEVTSLNQQLEKTQSRDELLADKLKSLEPENSQLRMECQKLQRLLFEAEDRLRHELQAMRERHKQRFTEATAKLRASYKSLSKRAKALEMQLVKNSDAMTALNEELQQSHGAIGQLKTSMKDILVQNQDLVEKNISLQESSSESAKVIQSVSEAQSEAARQLGPELSKCVEELHSLVSLSTSLLEGKDPSAVHLFGSKGLGDGVDSESLWLEGGYDKRLEEVYRLQEEIERLRVTVYDRVAAQVSSTCHVQ